MFLDDDDRSVWYKKKTKDVLVQDCVYLEKQRKDYSDTVTKLQSEVQELRRQLVSETSKRTCLQAVINRLSSAIIDLTAGVGVK